jgi:type I restriction enzyme S subunit
MINLVRLAEVATFMGGGTPSRANRHYFDGGIPWVKTTDLNNGPILSTEETLTTRGIAESSCKMVPAEAVLVAMYGGFNQIGRTGILTMGSAINQALTAIIANPSKLDPSFLLEWLNFRVGYWKRFAGSSRKDPNITKGDVAAFPVPRIEIERQRAISQILGYWNRAIDLTEKLLAEKHQLRNGLMQQLLTGKQRLPGFEKGKKRRTTRWGTYPQDWEYLRIGQLANHVSAKNKEGAALPVLSCTKYRGLVDSLKYFGKQVFSKDLSTYKVVLRGQFAYATNHIEEGSIGYQNLYDSAAISPMYTVFEAGPKIEDRFLFLLLKTELYRHIFEINTSASVDRRGSLRWPEFSRLHVPVPSLDEQQAIIRVFSLLDREVELIETKINSLRVQKKGLMQQLLTGKKRVTTCAT